MKSTFIFTTLVASFVASAIYAEDKEKTPDPKLVKQIQSLVRQLGAEDFQEREQAQKELLKLGKQVHPILKLIDIPDDPEVKRRLELIPVPLGPFVGSSWRINFPKNDVSLTSYVIQFRKNGEFTVTKRGGNSRRETWEFRKGVLYLYHNGRYATYEGRKVSENKIVGTAHNIRGKKWTWEAIRVDGKGKKAQKKR